MYFARQRTVPKAVRQAIDAADHFAASIDAFHEEEVPRAAVIRTLRPAGLPAMPPPWRRRARSWPGLQRRSSESTVFTVHRGNSLWLSWRIATGADQGWTR